MKPKYIRIKGQKIAYYESSGKGPAVVFVHGSNLSALTYRPQIESPFGEKFRLIALDLPGHGLSEPAGNPNETYSLLGLAGIVASLAGELQIGKSVYVGYSLAGNILLQASDRLNAHGFMISGSAPLDNPLTIPGKFLLTESALISLYKKHLSDEEIDAWTSLFFRPDSEFDRKPLIENIKRTDGTFREMLGQSALQGNYRDETDIVKSLSIPLAILHGDEERLVDKSYFDSLSIPALWRGAVQVIPGAGHLPNLEQPEAFNRLLEEFVIDVT